MARKKADQRRKDKMNFIQALKEGNRKNALQAWSRINAPKLLQDPIFISEDAGSTWKGFMIDESRQRINFDQMNAEGFGEIASSLESRYITEVRKIIIKRI